MEARPESTFQAEARFVRAFALSLNILTPSRSFSLLLAWSCQIVKLYPIAVANIRAKFVKLDNIAQG